MIAAYCACAELRHGETILRMENADFAGRVAVVTGAWRGLGRAAAARLHERGASVAVNVRNRERAEALAKEIGERAFPVPGDVAADGVPDEIAGRTLERLGLTRAAAKELGKFGITVNAICPGMIDTELTREHTSDELLERLAANYPVPRLGTALEVADLICFAASEAAGYITGASLDINGGDLMM